MSMLAPLLHNDPASPRLTVYDDARGVRMDFSAQTLDNWASKVANMLDEEFDAGDEVAIDLPVSWQAAVIAIGAYNSSRTPLIDASGVPNNAADDPNNVLNGIAHIPGTDEFYLTGKRWPDMYRVTFAPAG